MGAAEARSLSRRGIEAVAAANSIIFFARLARFHGFRVFSKKEFDTSQFKSGSHGHLCAGGSASCLDVPGQVSVCEAQEAIRVVLGGACATRNVSIDAPCRTAFPGRRAADFTSSRHPWKGRPTVARWRVMLFGVRTTRGNPQCPGRRECEERITKTAQCGAVENVFTGVFGLARAVNNVKLTGKLAHAGFVPCRRCQQGIPRRITHSRATRAEQNPRMESSVKAEFLIAHPEPARSQSQARE
jgi:hypothetical protein